MSSLARRTLRITAAAAGIAAVGVGFAGQAFAAPQLPALPDTDALDATPAIQNLDSASDLLGEMPAAPSTDLADLPPAFTFEAPTFATSGPISDIPDLPELPEAELPTAPEALTQTLPDVGLPTAGTHELPELPEAELPELPAAPADLDQLAGAASVEDVTSSLDEAGPVSSDSIANLADMGQSVTEGISN